MPDNTPLVLADKLSVAYEGKAIWQGASFTINHGEFVAVLGPNGAGKTTLFRLLLGLLKPAGGKLEVFGARPKRGNARIGYVPQRRPIDAEMNIEAAELVRLGLDGGQWGLAGRRELSNVRQAAQKALAAVDAEDLAHRPLGSLSGGELQRVFLAQALISEPDLLLLDEPLANLDIRREVQLVQLISKVVKTRHMAVLLIAHDLNPLLSVLDKVVYVANGRVASGEPASVITTEALSKLYGAPVEVLHDSKGRVAVLGTEEAIHHV